MSRYNHKKDLSTRDIWYRIGITIAAIAIVVYFLPRDNRTRYQFDLGHPWRYSPLIATFDFPIYKPDHVIQHEKDSMLKFYEPYFEQHTITGETNLQRFQDNYRQTLHSIMPEYYRRIILNRLKYIYSQGIIGQEDLENLKADSVRNIRIFSNNIASVQALESVFSQKSAYEYLTATIDSTHLNRYTLQQCDLNDYLAPNLAFDKKKSDEQRKELINSIPYASGMVLSGQKIIDRGEIIDQKTYNLLTSYEKELEKRNGNTTQVTGLLTGQILYVTLVVLGLVFYFSLFRRDYLEKKRNVMLLLSISAIFPLLTSFLVKHNMLSVYLIPYAMAPIFIRVFMDSRTAFITHITIVLLSAVTLKYPYEFIGTQAIAGMTAIYSLRELSQRSQLIRSAFFITLASWLFYLCLDLMHEHDWTRIDSSTYIYIAGNGILLLFAYPLLFVIEKVFGFTSNVTLVELSITNNELMRKMSEVAPGTFQHSMQVANLAEEVANKIGAKAQLVRTGAMYHDIGKICNPAFFTENQNGVNPHDNLPLEDSARIIINHIKDGLKLAEKHNLPTVIREFISTHHGNGLVKYFYISYKNKYPDQPVNEDIFRYPGPNPQTQEQAILMMADSVEAASRSLPEYTEESICNLVNKIIDTQVAEGFYKECPITFLDISTAKEVFKEKLKIIYHTRISYPELNKK